MIRICDRALNFFQIYDEEGSVRLCSWTRDGYLGKLTENSIFDLYNSSQAIKIRNRHINDDYSLCKVDACPYLSMDEVEQHKVSLSEIPSLPDSLFLGYERICNYACKSCFIHKVMKDNKKRDLEANYDKIEEEIRNVLPKIKHIGANGCGELFACNRTMNILSEWKPEADASECSVFLETNGSLFNEKNWNRIKNLGQYHLSVAISVMSFNEQVYQYLSGTVLPITNLTENLYYVKKLRESGVIDYLEIATVVQEQNFREMPEFCHLCIEEFGADYVRLRPYEWWGECSKDEAWFKDVRNPRHPLYSEYKKTMSHTMINHPKVHDWGGGLDSEWTSVVPAELQTLKLDIVTYIVLHTDSIVKRIHDDFGDEKKIYLYGLSNVGKVLSTVLCDSGFEVVGFIDRKLRNGFWNNIEIVNVSDQCKLEHHIPILITPVEKECGIRDELIEKGWNSVITLFDVIVDEKIRERLESI